MRQWTIDAFATEPFKGNPACVVEPFADWPGDAWMQALAAENNQAATAFLRAADDPARFGLRWFTPATELALCGHATLAASHVLIGEMGLAAARLTYDTQAGPLAVRRDGDRYQLDFPAIPAARIDIPGDLARTLGAAPVECWAGQYLIAILGDEAAIRGLKPDLAAVKAAACPEAVQGDGRIVVTARADRGQPYDVVSRFFAPGLGIAEDPTTGSMHCSLSPLWAAKLGRPALKFHQAFPGRGGDLECEHRGGRVLLRGQAVTVAEATLRLSPG